MITRIVKMHFKLEETANFCLLFESTKGLIAASDGCYGLRLVRDINNPDIFFTISKWESITRLDAYRNSALFASTWAKTKAMFAMKAMAWSTEEI